MAAHTRTRAQSSIKHDIISKDSTKVLIAVSVAVFLFVFCGFAVKSLFSQSLYNNKVISEKEKTRDRLKQNLDTVNKLQQSYEAFVNSPQNILGGAAFGTGPIDGNNAKIVLDALPGDYDYPALSSSFEKILVDGGYSVGSIGGAEDASAQKTPAATVKPIEIPYDFTFTASLDRTRELLATLERSIRPMHIDRLDVSVNANNELSTSVTLHTYYTQEKTFDIGSKVVK